MSTIAKKRNIFSILFSSEIDVEEYDYSDVSLAPELQATLADIERKSEVLKKGFNAGGKSSKSSFAKRIDPKTEEAMRAMHSKVVKREKTEDIERE